MTTKETEKEKEMATKEPDAVCRVTCERCGRYGRENIEVSSYNRQCLNRSECDTFGIVNNPRHYTGGAIECIDAIAEATRDLNGAEAFCVGNAMKYLWRFDKKNGSEDLNKAKWYIDRLIQARKKAGK